MGRPSIPPGVFFQMLLVGNFEEIKSRRSICWRCADSRSLAAFLGLDPTDPVSDHSSLSKTLKRLTKEVFDEVFRFLLRVAARKGLLWWQVAGDQFVDNRGERFRIKNGTTRLADKAEHAVDPNGKIVVSATVHPGTAADTATVIDTALDAAANLKRAGSEREAEESVADNGYHSVPVVTHAEKSGLRTYIPERQSPTTRRWVDKDPNVEKAVYGTRSRKQGPRGKKLSRIRSEIVERSFAHVCDSGGARRTWLRGLVSATKRHLMVVAARNLSTFMRMLFGIDTPRAFQGLCVLVNLAQLHTKRLLLALAAFAASLKNKIMTWSFAVPA